MGPQPLRGNPLSDPLAGYTPDWRQKRAQPQQPAAPSTDPLADYTPDWRGRVATEPMHAAPITVTEPPRTPPTPATGRGVSMTPEQQAAGIERQEGLARGVKNVAAGVPKFAADVVRGASSYTPEELRDPDVQAYLRHQGADPDALLHEAIGRRASGEPSGGLETAAHVAKGAATMGYDLQRAAQGGPLWEIGEDGKPRLVTDNPEQTPGEKIQAITELAGNAALFGSGVEPELRRVPIGERVRTAATEMLPAAHRAVAEGRRPAEPQPAPLLAAEPASANAGQAEPAAPTPNLDALASEAAGLSARVDALGNRLPPLTEVQRARLRELNQVLSTEGERMAREEPPPPLEQSGAVEKAPPPFTGADQQFIERYHGTDQTVRPDWIYRVPTQQIAMDPARFQFKEAGPEGVTEQLKGVTHWNPQAAGIVSVWRDPADGLLYVVNGHHRLELARRLGVPELNVQFIDATSAQEARASGAFLNMAEGRGTAIDVAKFLRDSNAGPEALAERGVSLRGDVVRDGLALSRLAPDVFDQVATGKAPHQWGVAIGALLEDPALQREALGAARSSGKRLSKQEVTEISRQVRDAGTEAVQQETLFGKEEQRHALYANRAQLVAALKRQLSTDRRLFGYVSREGRAEQLSRAGETRIDVDAAQKLAEHAGRTEEIFDRLYTRSGPIAEAVHEGATRIAQGERPATVAADVYPIISDAVARELAAAGGAGPHSGERAPAPGEGPAAPHEAPPTAENPPPEEVDPSQGGFFTTEARATGGGGSSRGRGVRQTERPSAEEADLLAAGIAKHGEPMETSVRRAVEQGQMDDVTARRLGISPQEAERFNAIARDVQAAERPPLELRPEPEGRAGQEALFGPRAGTEASRSLAQAESAARGELPRLREKLRLTRDQNQRMILASQIAQLEKLVNRAKPLTAEELQAQAAAREQQAPQVGPDQRDMFTVGAGGGRPRSMPQAGAPASAPVTPPSPAVAASGLARAGDAIKRMFAPASRTPESMATALGVREHAARLAIRGEQARAAVATFAKAWDAAPKAVRDLREQFGNADPAARAQLAARLYAQDDALQFIDRMEKGAAQPTPELTKAAAVLRDLMDGRRSAIQALGTGKLEHFIEDYFPHIWENPEQAQAIIGRILGNRPLEGPRSFLKQRTIPTVREGIEAGLVPVTWNPADLVLLKLREMDRYRMGQEIMAEEKASNRARFVSAFEKPKPGEIQINDHVATVYGPPTVPVVEAFDALVRSKMQQILRDIGVRHERKPNIGGERLGYAVSSGKDIVTRSAGPDAVIMHELGHAIDFQYKLWEHLTNIPGKTKEAIRARKVIHGELRALADLRYEGQQSVEPEFQRYVRNRYEKIANAIMALMYAPEKMQRAAPTIKARLTEFLRARPELAPILDVKPSLVHSTDTFEVPVGGMVIVGHYYAPEPVATILNNFLSPGLSGNVLFDAYRGVGNTLNQVQLGLSAFHLAFTSMDAAVSKAALGVEQAVAGHVVQGAGSLARFPIAPVENLIRGHKLLKELTHPGTGGPELAAIAESLVAGGGRVRMDSFYRNSAVERFWDALRRGRYFRAGLRSVPAALEYAAKPLMEWVVPRQKLGVFADMARFEISRLPKDATRGEIREAMAKVWDSVDNRMGQLVYDNLFWNKALKDLGMSSVRSLGWNIGTIREIGGGLVDTALAPARALKGERVLTHRMAYVVALPFVVGLSGGMLNYLFTGEPPKELKDYFFPRTGRLTPEGQPERVQLASYMRDVFHFARHPYRTLKGKLHPLITYIADMLENEDFYGNQIRNPHDPIVTQVRQSLEYTADQFVPIGVRQASEEKQRGQGGGRAGLSFIGITPAPREAVRSPAENLAHELLGARAKGELTPEEAQAVRERRQMADALRQGDPDALEGIRQAVRGGKLKPAQAVRMVKERRLSSLVRGFRMLTLSEAIDVLRAADEDERRALLPYFTLKAERAAQAGDRAGVVKARAYIAELRAARGQP